MRFFNFHCSDPSNSRWQLLPHYIRQSHYFMSQRRHKHYFHTVFTLDLCSFLSPSLSLFCNFLNWALLCPKTHYHSVGREIRQPFLSSDLQLFLQIGVISQTWMGAFDKKTLNIASYTLSFFTSKAYLPPFLPKTCYFLLFKGISSHIPFHTLLKQKYFCSVLLSIDWLLRSQPDQWHFLLFRGI